MNKTIIGLNWSNLADIRRPQLTSHDVTSDASPWLIRGVCGKVFRSECQPGHFLEMKYFVLALALATVRQRSPVLFPSLSLPFKRNVCSLVSTISEHAEKQY